MRFTIISAVLACAATAATAEQYTLGGFSPGGIGSMLGAGIDQAVRTEMPGSSVTYQPTGGGFANIALLERGDLMIALAHSGEVIAAGEGKPPFQTPVEDITALAVLYDWVPMQVMVARSVAEEYGLSTFSDIVTKGAPLRVAVNKRGNIVEGLTLALLEAAGGSYETIENAGGRVIFAASSEQVDLMRDRRVDAVMNAVFAGGSQVLEIMQSQDVVLLPVTPDLVAAVADGFGAVPFTIPAGTYAGQDAGIPSLSLTLLLIARADADPEMAYAIVRALGTQIDKLQGVTHAMRPITPEKLAAECNVPYHPGAIRYFKEANIAMGAGCATAG